MSFDSLLIHEATLNRLTQAGWEDGTPVPGGWAPVGEPFPARLDYGRPSESVRTASDQRGAIRPGTVFCRPGPDVRRSDRILIDDLVLEVLGVARQNDSGSLHHLEVAVEEVRGT